MWIRFSKTQEELEKIEKSAAKACPILYHYLMYPGNSDGLVWETPAGWNQALADFSYRVEALNRLYSKYHVSCEAEQIKEKFGSLRIYYGIVSRNPFRNLIQQIISIPRRWLFNVNYACKLEQTKKYIESNRTELTESEIEAFNKGTLTLKRRPDENSGQPFEEVEITDGKYFKVCKYLGIATSVFKPSKHKALYRLKGLLDKWYFALEPGAPTEKQLPIVNAFRLQVDELIEQAEREVESVCMICGATKSEDEHGDFCIRCLEDRDKPVKISKDQN